MRFYRALLFCSKNFGFTTTFKLVMKPRILSHLRKSNYYNIAILNWLEEIFFDIIKDYSRGKKQECKIDNNYKIWTFWWQGEKNMPEVIQLCNKSLLLNANGHEVICLSKENYKDYITFPDYVIEKVNKKIISLTHFSDILRLSLLSKYGGVWVDAALFVTRPISGVKGNFYTINLSNQCNPNYLFGKWVIGVMGCRSNYKPICFIKECLLNYWKRYNAPIEYLLFDYIMLLAYDNLPYFRIDVDKIEKSDGNLHSSRYLFTKKGDKLLFNNFIQNNSFLSLTWRLNYEKETDSGEKTYYGMLVDYYYDMINKSKT